MTRGTVPELMMRIITDFSTQHAGMGELKMKMKTECWCKILIKWAVLLLAFF